MKVPLLNHLSTAVQSEAKLLIRPATAVQSGATAPDPPSDRVIQLSNQKQESHMSLIVVSMFLIFFFFQFFKIFIGTKLNLGTLFRKIHSFTAAYKTTRLRFDQLFCYSEWLTSIEYNASFKTNKSTVDLKFSLNSSNGQREDIYHLLLPI